MSVEAPPTNLGLSNLLTLGKIGARSTLILAALVAGGAFSLQLSGLDPRAPVGADSASTRSQIAIATAFIVLLLSGAQEARRWKELISANWPLLVLPCLATLSVAWAPEPVTAFRRALALNATVLGAVALIAGLPKSQAWRILIQTLGAGVVLSLLYALICPSYGVHQVTDGVQSVHAGDWRGLFVHRTALGQLAALSLALSVYDEEGRPLARAGVAAAALLCLVKAHSGGGLVSAALLLATPPLFRLSLAIDVRRRWLAVGVAVGCFALAVIAAPMIAGLVLHALGKDATLTGRTQLWRLMFQAAAQRPLFGYGYSTGFRDVVAKLVAARSGFGYVPNAQNGYLDVLLNLGSVGLCAALSVLLLALWRALVLAWRTAGRQVIPLLIVVLIIEMNGVEAALISANDIFVLIFIASVVASGEMLKPEWRRP